MIAFTVERVLLTTWPKTVNPPEFAGSSSAWELSVVLMNHSLVALSGLDVLAIAIVPTVLWLMPLVVNSLRIGSSVVMWLTPVRGNWYPPPWTTPKVGEFWAVERWTKVVSYRPDRT